MSNPKLARRATARRKAKGNPNALLTIPDLSREIHRSLRTTVYMLSNGEGPPCVRFGHRVLFRRVAVDKWLRAREGVYAPARREAT